MQLMAAQDLGDAGSYINIAIKTELLMSSLILYIILRTINNNFAMLVLSGTLLTWIIAILYKFRLRSVVAPLMLLSALYFFISFSALVGNDFDEWRYCLFAAVIYGLIAIKHNIVSTKHVIFPIILSLLIVLCFYYIWHPLEIDDDSFESAMYNPDLDPRGIARPSYIFKHANEAGLFLASMFGYIIFQVRVSKGSKDWSDFLYLFLGTIVFVMSLYTLSFAAILTMLLFMCARIIRGSGRYLRYIIVLSVIVFVIVQAFFYKNVMDYLQNGSLWWRFWCADQVIEQSKAFDFDASNLGTMCDSWPHSFSLDLYATIGYVIAGFVLLSFVVWSFLSKDSTRVIMVNCLIVAALLQPTGALAAAFIALVVAWTAVQSSIGGTSAEEQTPLVQTDVVIR